jgi:carbamoyltransferase
VNVLGLWDGHDAGAALLQNGALSVAVNEERFTRRKLEIRFPARSIAACLEHAGLSPERIDLVAVSTSDPAKTLGRWWPASKERYYAVRRRKVSPGRMSTLTRGVKYRMTEWAPGRMSRALSSAALQRALARERLASARLVLVDHHEAHAFAAAATSGFDDCAVLTIDGLGDGRSSTVWSFHRGRLDARAASPSRHSLGVFFEHVTNLLNMRELEDEGKVMALADYASPIDDADNPLFAFIRVQDGVIRTAAPGHSLRKALAAIHWRYANEQFAFMAQRVVEHVTVALARDAVRLGDSRRLALAGGVASNVKATRRIRQSGAVDELYVFPHMGDGGLALGAAIAAAAATGEKPHILFEDLGLGPDYSEGEMSAAIEAAGLAAERPANVECVVAELLERDRVVMWFQGRMEYGPRALGHRSVLARPDRPALRDRLNLVLKRRVWYQPFCPSLLDSEGRRVLGDWAGTRNRFMTTAHEVAAEYRSHLAGVMSIDGTCRPQFVRDDEKSRFAALLHQARRRWGIGAVLNTSFNIHGEPLVCSPADAVDVFVRSGADALAIGPFVVARPGAGAAA